MEETCWKSPRWREPLPFAYESTGIETQFTNQWDPSPKSRNVFAFHKPETRLEYLEPDHQLNTRLTNLLTSDQKVVGSSPSRHATLGICRPYVAFIRP